MSKILSYRGKLDAGLEDRIKLSTQNGKRGYRIVKFQTMVATPGAVSYETTTKIYTKAQGSGSTGVDFTESDLLAVSYIEDGENHEKNISEVIIFDKQVFNQDIFVNTASLTGTAQTNYYIELETVALTDVQSTQLTLKNLRNIASR
jgi:hypothetical protein